MIKLFKCPSGFYAVTYYESELKTWFVYWSASKDLSRALVAVNDCIEFLGRGAVPVIICN